MESGLGLDLLQQIVNVQWETLVEQQGLLTEYPPGSSYSEVMSGTSTAYALDSGDSFEGVNMGASGLGYTVLTPGLVCFGKPKDGDACFIASPDGISLQRGILAEEDEEDEEGDGLAWSATSSGGDGVLMALSFAGDAFFAVRVNFTEPYSTSIATSFDGETWTSTEAFGSTGYPVGAAIGGSVAAIIKKNSEGVTTQKTYVAAGDIGQDNAHYENFVHNLMWATSSDATHWTSESNEGQMAEPGAWLRLILNYACAVAAGPVNETEHLFVAPAATKTLVNNPIEPDFPYAMLSAAAAVSENGSGWDTIALPGALAAGLNQISWGLAVTFVRTKANKGYFLMSDHEINEGEEGDAVPNSNLYRSDDGRSWSKIKTSINWMATLSTIAKDLSKTKIVHI